MYNIHFQVDWKAAYEASQAEVVALREEVDALTKELERNKDSSKELSVARKLIAKLEREKKKWESGVKPTSRSDDTPSTTTAPSYEGVVTPTSSHAPPSKHEGNQPVPTQSTPNPEATGAAQTPAAAEPTASWTEPTAAAEAPPSVVDVKKKSTGLKGRLQRRKRKVSQALKSPYVTEGNKGNDRLIKKLSDLDEAPPPDVEEAEDAGFEQTLKSFVEGEKKKRKLMDAPFEKPPFKCTSKEFVGRDCLPSEQLKRVEEFLEETMGG